VTLERILTIVTERLGDLEIPYMVVGSIASGLHGMFRTTYDADIVIDPTKGALKELCRLLEKEFYADEEMALDALNNGLMFNVIHKESGNKIDLIVRKPRVYDRMSLSRRIKATYQGRGVWFQTPEDTILAKLDWARESRSERQLQDALNVMKQKRDTLDVNYLKEWAKQLNVEDTLNELLALAGLEGRSP
jgi:hypothetical protein